MGALPLLIQADPWAIANAVINTIAGTYTAVVLGDGTSPASAFLIVNPLAAGITVRIRSVAQHEADNASAPYVEIHPGGSLPIEWPTTGFYASSEGAGAVTLQVPYCVGSFR